jgi:hypothetical protein
VLLTEPFEEWASVNPQVSAGPIREELRPLAVALSDDHDAFIDVFGRTVAERFADPECFKDGFGLFGREHVVLWDHEGDIGGCGRALWARATAVMANNPTQSGKSEPEPDDSYP